MPITSYLSLILKQSFGRFEVNMLTIPSYVIFIIQLLFWTWVSEKTNQRFITGLISQIWCLPLLIASELLPGDASRWVKFTLATLLVGAPYVHAINVAITSRNAGSVRTRTVASALYNMFVQTSNIIGSNVSVGRWTNFFARSRPRSSAMTTSHYTDGATKPSLEYVRTILYSSSEQR